MSKGTYIPSGKCQLVEHEVASFVAAVEEFVVEVHLCRPEARELRGRILSVVLESSSKEQEKAKPKQGFQIV